MIRSIAIAALLAGAWVALTDHGHRPGGVFAEVFAGSLAGAGVGSCLVNRRR